jgi:hypothetical protein
MGDQPRFEGPPEPHHRPGNSSSIAEARSKGLRARTAQAVGDLFISRSLNMPTQRKQHKRP